MGGLLPPQTGASVRPLSDLSPRVLPNLRLTGVSVLLGVGLLSVFGAPLDAIMLFTATPFLAYTPLSLAARKRVACPEGEGLDDLRRVLENGRDVPVREGGGTLTVHEGGLVVVPAGEADFSAPVTTSTPPSLAVWHLVGGTVRYGAAVAVLAHAALLLSLVRDWLPVWGYLVWMPLVVWLGAAYVLWASPGYSTPPWWKMEYSGHGVGFGERIVTRSRAER